MARLNIEDEFFMAILGIVGPMVDVDRAHGNALRFIRFAQEKYKTGRIITDLEFDRLGFLPDLVGIFAEKVDGGYRAIGDNKFFSWIHARAESGQIGGRISAQRPRDEFGRLMPKQTPSTIQADSKQDPSKPKQDPSKPKRSQASPSPSLMMKKQNFEIQNVDNSEKKRRTPDPFHPKSATELWAGMSQAKKDVWNDLYNDPDFIQRTLKRAFSHYHDDKPGEEPRARSGWTRALNHWFENDWLKHVKSKKQSNYTPRYQNGPTPIRYPSVDQVFAEQQESREKDEPPVSEEEKQKAEKELNRLLGRTGNFGKEGA